MCVLWVAEIKYVGICMVGQKNRLFSDLITLWLLVLERRAVCQNFCNFIEKKGTKLAFQWVSIFFAKFAQIVTTAAIMVYMTRTHGLYSIYTNIQWNNCHFPTTELVQMFHLVKGKGKVFVTERWARSWSRCTGSQPAGDVKWITPYTQQ